MNFTKTNENYIAAIVMAVAVCFSFFSMSNFAHAEEMTTDDEAAVETEAVTTSETEAETETETDGGPRAAMLKQIESLRTMLSERKAAMEARRDEVKSEIDAEREVRKLTREEFFASIANLEGDEKRASMVDFIESLQAQIAERQAERDGKMEEMKTEREEVKTERTEIRDEFHASFDGLSRGDKLAAILERVAALKLQIQNKIKGALSSDDSEDEDVSADDSDDDSEEMDDDDDSSDDMGDETEYDDTEEDDTDV